MATARLGGRFAAVTRPRSVAALRRRFGSLAASLGLADLDAAALKSAEPRELTQQVARWLWATPTGSGGGPVDGVRFDSRHGDGVGSWAVFRRPGDPRVSLRLTDTALRPWAAVTAQLAEAFAVRHLAWGG